MSLAGRTALVTGASRGLGRAIALRLARDGASLAINYSRREDRAESLASEIQSCGAKAIICRADVGSSEQVTSMVERISAELGPVDVLVNNAAVFHSADVAEYDQARYEELQRVNVGGMINTTLAVLAKMKDRRFGRIVNVTSIAAHGTSLSGTTFYAATKASVTLLTRRFAMDLGQFGITVNAVAPGFVPTDMTADGLQTDRIIEATMVRRLGTPEDIAHAVAFLASPESGFITAQTLTVDGGRMDYIAHP
jgi:3-oxoacyl-[acyl-carrier protein] reductase